MSQTLDILLSEPVTIRVGEQIVSVREISGLQLMAFAEKLSATATEFFRAGTDGSVRLDLSTLPALVRGASSLSTELLTSATGLPPEELGKLPARALLIILDQAIAINFSEEFIGAGKAVAARLQGIVPGLGQATSAASSNSSGTTATA
jgi:hypothetical protein